MTEVIATIRKVEIKDALHESFSAAGLESTHLAERSMHPSLLQKVHRASLRKLFEERGHGEADG